VPPNTQRYLPLPSESGYCRVFWQWLLSGETHRLHRMSFARLLAACLLLVLWAGQVAAQAPAPPRPAAARPVPSTGTIQAIQVEGNQRIEAGTIRSYMLVQPGDPFDPTRLDNSLKTLYATGLFQDVRLDRQGDTLIVHVIENPIVSRVAFQGNHEVDDDQLRPVVQLRPSAVFTAALAEADRQRILDAYAGHGYYDATVTPQIIRLPQNRVDVIFDINDGAETLISKITFVGNHRFSQSRLADVIESREQRWWRFLSTSDQYDPERLNLDKQLLRNFYLKQGYVDVDIRNATAELSPNRRGFFLTFFIHEGERYRVGRITINSQLPHLPGSALRRNLKLDEGDWYDGDAIARSSDAIEDDVRSRGYAFVNVKPRADRDPAKHIVNLTFDVGEGPRVYVERINIIGNTRTQDKVIRRQFLIAEGDPFSAEALRKTRQRLQDLNYFSKVDIQPSPGSAPDKAIINTTVEEKSTGELTFGGGYSTDIGPLLDIGLGEHNLVGSGVSADINGVLATKSTSIDLSATDPYFLDRNLIAGGDIFFVQTNYLGTEPYDERRQGFDVRLGYNINDHLQQVWNYTLANRTVFNVITTASPFILNEAGTTLLSQVGQQISLDYRDSKIDPHSGYLLTLGTDFAGVGGDETYVRASINGTYYIPLERFTGNPDWDIKLAAGAGQLFQLGHQEQIIDRFFLGGDNLRGFEVGGAGPHDAISGDPLGGRFIWTQTTELRFPLPVSRDLGISGHVFADMGALTEASFRNVHTCIEANGEPCQISNSGTPRMGFGFGITWNSSFGLINIDLTPFVVKQAHDQTQLFRFGFGTRF